MALGKPPPKRKKHSEVVGVTFSLLTLQRLDKLVAKGSHGGGRQEVIRHLVELGVREAMKDGFIPMEDD